MRSLMPTLVLAALLAVPPSAPADDLEPEDDGPTRQDITREQIEALRDLESAETDEEAEEAEERFNDASDVEVQRRRAVVDDFIERGGDLPPSPRPPAPHP